MGRIIVINTKKARTPFKMKESGHLLYSYEELCYYIKARMPLWLMETNRIGLTAWIRDRGVEIEDMDTLSPIDAAKIILSAGEYYSKEETSQIVADFEQYEKITEAKREKEKGDFFLLYGRLKNAALSYEKAVCSLNGEEEESFLASLFHNRGIVCCHFFYWEAAKENFKRAYSIKESPETAAALDFTEKMEKEAWEIGGNTMLAIEIERKEKEFLDKVQ
ncbi:MAG: hypothetical protein Q4B70_11680 [Lachnospiraceae bacterium]|nr:hypothetical protein [Lachnospiraceae bacterium]